MAGRARLTLKQSLFSEYYIGESNGNATDAARRAGYHGSDATLAQIGYENLQRPEIAAHVAERVAAVAMSTDEILLELSDIGRAPWGDFIQVVTNPKTGETIDVRMPLEAKLRALELLGKHRKLWVDRSEVAIVAKALIGIDLDKM